MEHNEMISRYYNGTDRKIELGDVVKNTMTDRTGRIKAIGNNAVLVRRTKDGAEICWPYKDLRFLFSGTPIVNNSTS